MTTFHDNPPIFRAVLDSLAFQPLPDGRRWAYHRYAANSAPAVLARRLAEADRRAGVQPFRVSTNPDPWAPRYGSPTIPSKHSDSL